MKLEQAVNVRDVRELARRRLPRMIFDLVDGGAEDEVTMRANEAAFSQIEFRPRTLVDVSQRTVATSVAGMPIATPFILAPAAGTRVVHPDAERAVARAAGQRHVPYVVTARASFTIEELAEASQGPLWFGIEVIPDPDLMKSLLQRAYVAELLRPGVHGRCSRSRQPRTVAEARRRPGQVHGAERSRRSSEAEMGTGLPAYGPPHRGPKPRRDGGATSLPPAPGRTRPGAVERTEADVG